MSIILFETLNLLEYYLIIKYIQKFMDVFLFLKFAFMLIMIIMDQKSCCLLVRILCTLLCDYAPTSSAGFKSD